MSAPVAIIVVSFNTSDLLAECLESMHAAVSRGLAEVWVVDNNSTDGSQTLVRTRFPWARLIASPDNLGFGAAVNLGAREATGVQWIAPANADVALLDGALEALIGAGDHDPAAGAVAPRLIQPDGATQHSLHPFPTVGFTALFNLGLQRISARWADAMCLEAYWDADQARRVPWALGAFMLVRRAAWDQIGGFDERRWMYAEDLDLGWRLARAGWATRYEPGARVRHAVSAATEQVWGDGRTEIWMRATYDWMLQRRGATITRIVAALNVMGAGFRWLWRIPAAMILPSRFTRERDEFRAWTKLHAIGLRSSRRVRLAG
jgi:GT2 family glycosyltransferase